MNFDRLAPHYDWLEALTAGERLQAARTAWLEELAGCRRILSAGEGHGRFAAVCTSRFPQAKLTCVEASPRMVARAQARCGSAVTPVEWQCSDLLAWTPPPEKYDAIVTCFFLDCFPPGQLAEVVARLAACAAEEAVWLVVDFAVPVHGPARWRAHAVHAVMYAFFRAFTDLPARRLTPPNTLLCAQGFQRFGKREFEWGLVSAELWRRPRVHASS